jgi:hypothetical protein
MKYAYRNSICETAQSRQAAEMILIIIKVKKPFNSSAAGPDQVVCWIKTRFIVVSAIDKHIVAVVSHNIGAKSVGYIEYCYLHLLIPCIGIEHLKGILSEKLEVPIKQQHSNDNGRDPIL